MLHVYLKNTNKLQLSHAALECDPQIFFVAVENLHIFVFAGEWIQWRHQRRQVLFSYLIIQPTRDSSSFSLRMLLCFLRSVQHLLPSKSLREAVALTDRLQGRRGEKGMARETETVV